MTALYDSWHLHPLDSTSDITLAIDILTHSNPHSTFQVS